jgi:hypothetical protein
MPMPLPVYHESIMPWPDPSHGPANLSCSFLPFFYDLSIPVQFLWFDGDDRDDDGDVADDGDGDDDGGDAASDDFIVLVMLMLEPLCQSSLSVCSLSVVTPCGL